VLAIRGELIVVVHGGIHLNDHFDNPNDLRDLVYVMQVCAKIGFKEYVERRQVQVKDVVGDDDRIE
jgi:hypothetical protein